MAALCTLASISPPVSHAVALPSKRFTTTYNHSSTFPRRSGARIVRPCSVKAGRSLDQTLASSCNSRKIVSAPRQQLLDDANVAGLWSLPVDQRQALLFLATSSGILAAADLSQASDLQSLAALQLDRGQVISFLVNNPFVTLGLAVALYIIVPRILRLTVKYILLPVSIAGVVYLIITNPSTSVGVGKTAFNYITANPAITSVAILGVLALALSPYVLVIGGIVLVFSAGSLPSPLKKLLPEPVVEAERQLDFVREQVKGPAAQVGSKLNSFKDSIFGTKPKALARAQLDSLRLLPAPSPVDHNE